MNENKILLVDLNGIIFRSYYRAQKSSISALVLFLYSFKKILTHIDYTHIIVCSDYNSSTFRKSIYPHYKSHRPKLDKNIITFLNETKNFINEIGMPIIVKNGYEADDIIATYSKVFSFPMTIVSNDKDLIQLLNHRVQIFNYQSQKYITEQIFLDDMKITPKQYTDILALSGDSADNIPGAPGIGLKTAIKIISLYDSLDNLYKQKEILFKKKEILIEYKDQILLSRKLVQLVHNLPLIDNLDYFKVNQDVIELKVQNKISSLLN